MPHMYYYAYVLSKGCKQEASAQNWSRIIPAYLKGVLAGLLFLLLTVAPQLAQAQKMLPAWSQSVSNGRFEDLERDAAGNIYVTGQKHNGKGYDVITTKYNAAGQEQWSKIYDYGYNYTTYNYGSQSQYNGNDIGKSIAVDAAGNVYVAGSVVIDSYQYYDDGWGPYTANVTRYLVVKYDASGNQQWARTYGGGKNESNTDVAEDIAVDAAGNVFVTGRVLINHREESYSCGSFWDSRTCYRDYYDYVFATIKYNASGAEQWVATYNGTVDYYDGATALALDGTGNVYVTGRAYGGTNSDNIVTIKYSNAGAQQWAKVYTNSTNYDEAAAIETDAAGNVYVIGSSTGFTYNPTWGYSSQDPAKEDFITLKYRASDGAQLWAKAYNGPGNNADAAKAVTVDASGNVYVAGSSLNGKMHLATVKYNSGGTPLWSRTNVFAASSTSYSSPDGANAVEIDVAGNVYVTGSGGGYFVGAKYNSAGTQQWTIEYNDGNGSYGAVALAVDADGNPYMAGDEKVIKFSPNFAPVAVNDAYETDEDQTLTVSLTGNHLLKNDTDADGNSLTAAVVAQPTKGTLTLNANGTFTYKPNTHVNGTDSFTYKANDGREDSETATVTVTINPVNDAPSFVLAEGPRLNQDLGPQTISDFASGIEDGDPELTQNYSFLITANSTPTLFKTAPTISKEGKLTFESAAGASGVATIKVKLKDDGGAARGGKDESEEQMFSITIIATNIPPILANVPATASIPELKAYTFTATATDADQPAQTLTFSLADAPAGAVIEPTTGVFTWTPTEAQGPGTYSIKVKVTDGVATVEKQLVLTVTEANTSPVLSGVVATATVPEMQLYTFTAAATDTDLPKQNLLFTVTNAPSGAQINASTGVFTWTPTEAQGPGSYSMNVRVTDGLVSVEKTIVVIVTEANVAPLLTNVPATATIPELQVYTLTATATDADTPAQSLSFSLVNAPEGAAIGASTGTFTWTPTEAQGPGVYAFKVRVSDGVTTTDKDIALTVTESNQLPILAGVPVVATLPELQAYTFTATAKDADAPVQPLTFSLANAPAGATIHASTGVFSWTPTEAQGPGVFIFKVQVSDGVGMVEQNVTLTVTEANEAPVLAVIPPKTVKEETLLAFKATVTDEDLPANNFTFALVNGPAGAKIHASTGEFTWTPSEAQGPKTYTFTIRVTDSGSPAKSHEQQVSVTVEEVNEAPVLAAVPAAGTVQELQAYAFTATATDSDDPAQTLTFSLVGAPVGANINSSTGAFSWTPTEGQGPGSFTFKVRVSDGSAYAEKSITLQVTEVNTAPVLAAIQDQTIEEEKPFTFTAQAADSDLPVNTFAFSLLNGPAGATLNAASGVFAWTPSEAQGPGSYSMTIRVTDNGLPAMTHEQTFTLTVKEVNKAPVLASVPASATVCEQQAYTFTATATDLDLPANTLRFSLVNAPSGASINANTGVFAWVPNLNQGGSTYPIMVQVSDETISVEKQLNITVNKLPAISAQPQDKTLCAGNSHTFTVQAIGGSLTYRWQVDQGNGFSNLSNGGIYAGVTTASLTITGATAAQNKYKYRVQVAGVCVPGITSEVAVLQVLQPLQAGTINTNQTVCYNTVPAALNSVTAASGGDGAYQYVWESSENSSTWVPVLGATNAAYVPKALTKTTFFRRKVSTADGCSGPKYSNVVQVTVLDEQKPGVLAEVAPVCYKTAPAELLVTGQVGVGAVYQWQESADNSTWRDISGARSASYKPGSLSVSTFFRRKVTFGTGTCGALFTNPVRVEVYPMLKGGTIGSSQTILYSDAPALLSSEEDALGGTGTVSYQWETSTDGTNFTPISGATAPFYQPGPLTVKTFFRRQATDAACGTAVSNRVEVKVETRRFEEQEIPNALFPQGSDRNKTWGIAHMGLTGKVNLRVFDKSGRVLFSTDNPAQEWDGKYSGKAVPEDTYFYSVQLPNGKQIRGSIRVIY